MPARLLACVLAAAAAAAETERRVEGRVLDLASGAPLRGASVEVGPRRTLSDPDGRFALVAPRDALTLRVAAPGYAGAAVAVDAGEDVRGLEILLAPAARFEERVSVVAPTEEDQPGAIPVRPGQVLAVPGAADNVFRVLPSLPGVAATDEFTGRLAVRGGGPDQNLTVMDGVEVHDPFRLFGLVSAFNPETVERFELTAGGFDVRHGDRLSSLLSVANRDGTREEALRGSATLGVTDGNVVLEGRLPGPGGGSWLLSGRRTYYDLVAERFVDQSLPQFADLQARLAFRPGARTRLTLFGLRSREGADILATDEEDGERGAFADDSGNDLVSLRLDSALGTGGFARTVVALYDKDERVDGDFVLETDSRRANAPGAQSFTAFALQRDLAVRDWSVRQEAGLTRASHAFEAGFEAHRLTTRLRFLRRGDTNPAEANGSSFRGGAGLPLSLDSARRSTRGGAWLQARLAAASWLTLEPGLRLDAAGANGRTTWSPRFAAATRLGRATRLRLAAGLYTQSPGYEKLVQSDYLVDLGGEGPLLLDHERSAQLLLRLEQDLPAGLELRAEAYLKGFRHLIVGRLETEEERLAGAASYDFPPALAAEVPRAPIITTAPVNGAEGSARGLDFYLGRTGSARGFGGWMTYSLSRAERTAYSRTYPFEYDRRHAVSLVAWGRLSRRFVLSGAMRAASGFPYTPARGVRVSAVADARDADGDGNRQELVPERDAAGRLVWVVDLGGVDNLNTGRLPVFARLDLRATFRPRGETGRLEVYAEVINAWNRRNAGALVPELRYDRGADRPRLVEVRQGSVPRLVTAGARFRF
jgi:hypothetical protein